MLQRGKGETGKCLMSAPFRPFVKRFGRTWHRSPCSLALMVGIAGSSRVDKEGGVCFQSTQPCPARPAPTVSSFLSLNSLLKA